MIKVTEIVVALNELDIDAFLVTEFKGRDPMARSLAGLGVDHIFSRRWYLLIHKNGTISTVTHNIEPDVICTSNSTEFQVSRFYYSSRQELERALISALHNTHSVAMTYSPRGEIPVISTVDAGTVEHIKALGITVVSAAELLQRSICRLDQSSYLSHIAAGRKVDQIRKEAFEHIAKNAGRLSEYDAVAFILNRFNEEGLITSHPPCVAVNSNSSLPHYEPSKESSRIIKKGDFVLIDLWAKLNSLGAIYYDITWVGVLRSKPTSEELKVFEVVKSAREGVVDFIKNRTAAGDRVEGREADNLARKIISEAGYGDYFIHRTGHSISTLVHGEGANLDGFESSDSRQLIPYSCFSVEPGIYLKNFGIRSELNVFMLDNSVEVTGEVQSEILCLA